ncbi:MAG: hypothetical protein KGV59_04325 [Tenacibaculum sp.]|nr:hypothetical protein [Tenacibaculum sp.]
MKNIKPKKLLTVLSIVCLAIFTSCSNEDKIENSVLTSIENDKGVKTELDEWIEKNFTLPYNTKLVYKYDDAKIPQDDYATPVSYEKAVQMANILKYLFFEPYEKFTSKEFLRSYAPKEIVLMGSSVVNPNGTEKLGLAESGVKFTLFKVNSLDVTNPSHLFRYYFRTIFHEFSHILHQTKLYSADFRKLSATNYVRDSWSNEWYNKNNPRSWGKPISLELGFITNYSSNNDNDDFVELISHYLTYTPEKWNETLELAGFKRKHDKKLGLVFELDEKGKKIPTEGKKILQKKIRIVKNYMYEVWGINMDELRDEILSRASKLHELDINTLK